MRRTEQAELFPELGERERYRFPDPLRAAGDSPLGVGGNLSAGMLLSAYEQGIFPWFSREDPPLWWSPDPRFVLYPETLHISDSMRRVLKKKTYAVEFDRDFPAVIAACSQAERPGQNGTWITDQMIAAYTRLHALGWAHSSEAYREDRLVGGCYGIRLGRAFFGESMFTRESNASKAAFLVLARALFDDGVVFIDCQVPTDHLRSLGAREVDRAVFLRELADALADRGTDWSARDQADRRGAWRNHARG